MNIVEFIKKVPKTELHLHIEGTLEPDHMFKLAKKNNIFIPFKNIKEVKEAYNFSNLESFLKIYYEGSKVLIMGFTFKENCCDTRNTGTSYLIDELLEYDMKPIVWDPWINEDQSYNGCLIKKDLTLSNIDYSAILLTVAHKQFVNLTINEWNTITKNGESIIIDLKGAVPKSMNPLGI